MDSTTGVQMAYVKQWAPRSFNPLELRVPELLAGGGRAIRGDAVELVRGRALGHFDLAYLDPPYNQHRYFTNYHVWETLVAWDAPEAYGVARKRVDARDPSHTIRVQLQADHARCPGFGGRGGGLRPPGPLLQRRVVARPRRARGDVRGVRAPRRGHARLRLGPLRGGPHRHLRPLRPQGRAGEPPLQPGVAGHRRRRRDGAPGRRGGRDRCRSSRQPVGGFSRPEVGVPAADRLQQTT